jgi:hypothetical protein
MDKAGNTLFMTMKTLNWISGLLLAGVLLAFTGCGKADKSTEHGLPAAMARFDQAFASPTPEQKDIIFNVVQGLRYRRYPDTLAALDTLSSVAGLNDAQKKAVSDVTQEVKQAQANTPVSPVQ